MHHTSNKEFLQDLQEAQTALDTTTAWLPVELRELHSKPSIATTKTLADSLSPILKENGPDPHREQPRAGNAEILDDAGSKHHSLKFWLVFVALCMTSLLGGLDSTAMSTSLGTVSTDIGGQEQYVWFANVSTITMTAVQPLFGQLANVFGRRSITLLALGIFILGSGISGGALNPGKLECVITEILKYSLERVTNLDDIS